MRRRAVAPRPGWQQRIEGQGLLFHTPPPAEGSLALPYWAEGTYYELTRDEVDSVHAATDEIQARCLDAVEHVIRSRRYAELGIPPAAIPLIEQAWEQEPPSLYGRLDLALTPTGPKLLEYNADTPTSLLEAAVIQWTWLEDCFPNLDQYNSLHDRLIATWRDLGPHLRGARIHFGCVPSLEDEMTVAYLRDTAEQAGLATEGILMEDIGWDEAARRFVDLDGHPLHTLFKLYPWEGLLSDGFGPCLGRATPLQWIEPIWKMLLASKGILALLWELFPEHPLLLPAGRTADARLFPYGWVRKPLHGREGSNVQIAAPGITAQTGGPYDDGGFVYQAFVDLGEYQGLRPVLGSWIVGGEAAGLGIRESPGYVTDNTARFVPHLIADSVR